VENIEKNDKLPDMKSMYEAMDGEVNAKMILCKNMQPRGRNVAAGSGGAGE
jgi:hypothetical protein